MNYADSIADSVTKLVLRFVERVCLEADINTDHVKTLQSLVPGRYFSLKGHMNPIARELIVFVMHRIFVCRLK